MRRMAALTVVCLLTAAASAAALDFSDSANINVLRQYDPVTGDNLVQGSYDVTGMYMQYDADIDGSGLCLQFNNADSADDVAVITYTLPGERTVDSYFVQWPSGSQLPANFKLEGYNGAEWVVFADYAPAAAGTLAESFTEATVTQIRATFTGPSSGGAYILMNELRVFMKTGQAVNVNDGYNYLPDKYNGGFSSSNSTLWAAPYAGPASLIDQNFSSHTKATAPSPEGGNRAFVVFDLGGSIQMSAASLGGYHGQNWGNWECYTAPDGDPPALQNIDPPGAGETIKDKITQAGWTLQHEHGAGSNAMDFIFNHPGQYRWLALVWDVQGGACSNFELYGGLTPARVAAFELADPDTGDTEYTESRTLNVTAFDGAPSSGGTAIVGYMITESDVPPAADDPNWLAEAPGTFEITGPSRLCTFYGWVKDDIGEIAGAAHTIRFRDPLEPVKFADSTKINVLRQINPATGENLVTSSYEVVGEGVGLGTRNSNDASASPDWYGMGFDAEGEYVRCTYELPGARTVGSYMVQLHSAGELPARFVLEGWDGFQWTTLADVQPAEARWTGTFEPSEVTSLRYTAYGPSGNDMYMRLTELHVYMAAGQSVQYDSGYNIMRDATVATATASNSSIWATGGSAGILIDADFHSHVKATSASPQGGGLSFVAYTMIEPVLMSAGTLGCYDSQTWNDWQVYTANGDTMPELQNIPLPTGPGETLQDKIIQAGWTLQHTHGSGGQSMTFTFDAAGTYKYLAIVWPVQGGAAVQFELYGGQLPCRINEFEVADQVTGSTELTESRTVDVTKFNASPSTQATAITGYMITESDEPPGPNDFRWLSEPPAEYTFQTAENQVTLYAWARDDAGNVAGASFSILYRNPFAQPKFNTSANVNVLREYDVQTGQSLVTKVYNVSGVSISTRNSTGADGLPDQYNGVDADSDWATCTYTLPGPRNVASYLCYFNSTAYLPKTFLLEGLVDEEADTWVTLASLDPVPAVTKLEGTFETQTVTKIRYTITGQGGSQPYVLLQELMVFMPPGEGTKLSDGFSYMYDQSSTTTTTASAGSAVWAAVSDNPNVLMNREFNGHVKAQEASPEGGEHAFVTFSFMDDVPMSCGTLGGYHGQQWSNWQVYTSDAEVMPELQNITAPGEGETLEDKIIAAGWTLQHTHGAGSNSADFTFDQPGDFRHLAIVWPIQWDATVELELFGAGPMWPIPGDATLDCKVNILDLIFVRNRLNQDVATGDNWRADVNEDNKINILDLIFVRNKLNTQCAE